MNGKPDDSGGPRREDDGRSALASSLRKAGPFIHLGWSIAISVVLGAGVGYWLDKRFDTSPWLLIAGSILGIAAGLIELTRASKRLS